MTPKISPVHVAIEGMRHSLSCLISPDATQASVFTNFSHFVMRSAQARNQFIREYSARTGKKAKTWTAEMWTSPVVDAAVAELFHALRVDDFHAEPFVIEIEETAVFAVPINGSVAHVKTGPSRIQASLASALFGNSAGPHLRVYLNGTTGLQDGDPADVVSYSCRYVLGSATRRVAALLSAAGTDDVVELATRQMRSMEAYEQWFEREFPSP